MKDTTAIGSAAGAITAVGLGSIAGVPLDSLVYGLMGGIVAVLTIPPKGDAPQRAGLALYLALAGSVLVSVLVAAALGPMTTALLSFSGIEPLTATRAFSFLWGAGAQAGLLLSAIEALRRRIEQLGGPPP